MSRQSVDPDQTAPLIRLLLADQSDQVLHCLPFRLHFSYSLLYGKATLFKLYDNYSKDFGCPNIFPKQGPCPSILFSSDFLIIEPLGSLQTKLNCAYACLKI